jgi:hypothetical protein
MQPRASSAVRRLRSLDLGIGPLKLRNGERHGYRHSAAEQLDVGIVPGDREPLRDERALRIEQRFGPQERRMVVREVRPVLVGMLFVAMPSLAQPDQQREELIQRRAIVNLDRVSRRRRRHVLDCRQQLVQLVRFHQRQNAILLVGQAQLDVAG